MVLVVARLTLRRMGNQVHRMPLAALLWIGSAGVRAEPAFDYPSFLAQLRVPADFTIELAAGVPVLRFPMFACLDEEGRLYVAESSGNDLYRGLETLSRDCRVLRLEDSDGDGRFDRATVFQDRVTFPMGLAWREDRLYLADPPDLVALSDTDGDGRADRREVILSGFGHTDNGSLHGLTFGPDGFLYFTMGTPDGWKLPQGDGSFLEGISGALFRCRPDGSRLEVVSRGFVNLVEVEFLPGGEIIGTDNWYQLPAGGYRDALVDCAPGGLYPYAPDIGTPLPRTGITLPPLILTPAVAHSGIVRLRTDGFPADWRDNLFVAEHNTRKVVRYELRREASTFAATAADFATSEHPDFHPSDVLEDADGSLLIVDTGGWYVEHCPTGRIRSSRAPGGIYRVRWSDAPKADGGGGRLKWREMGAPDLVRLLDETRSHVAERAASELVRRGETGTLMAALADGENPAVRRHVVWPLAQMPGEESLGVMLELLDDPVPETVAAIARALVLRGDKDAGDHLASLLDSAHASVRRAAAEALAVCGGPAHAERLASALASAADDFEEHACIAALLALADEAFVRGLLGHGSPRVRRAALHLLDQPPIATLEFSDLVPALGDEDALLRAAAVRLLEGHAEWANAALPWLRKQLEAGTADAGDAVAPGALMKAFQTNPGVRELIGETLAAEGDAPQQVRGLMLKILPTLTAEPPEPSWLRAILEALENPVLRAAALHAATAYPSAELEPVLTQLAEDPSVPRSERLLAARAGASEPVLGEGVFELALSCLPPNSSASERSIGVELLGRARLSARQLVRLLEDLEEAGTVSPEVLLRAMSRAASDGTRPALGRFFAARLEAGWSPSRAAIEQVLAIFPASSEERAVLAASWEENHLAMPARLREFLPLLKGGDAARGRESFGKAACAGCHRVGEFGSELGPDLTKIGAIRSGEDLLESILYPSASFAQGYEPYRLTRRDGEELYGNLVEQGSEGVTLCDAGGMLRHVAARDVALLERQELSAMPEGLERLLTREQFRDLLEYLQSLR